MERRCRVPVRLAEYAPLLGVGLRHLLAEDGLSAVSENEPVKQVRLKYSSEDQAILDQLVTQFETRAPRIIIAALECAARCRLVPEAPPRRAAAS